MKEVHPAGLSNCHITTDNARTRDASFHPTAVRSTRSSCKPPAPQAVPSTRPYPQMHLHHKPCLARARTCKPPTAMPCPARARTRRTPAPQAVPYTRPYAQPTRFASRAKHAHCVHLASASSTTTWARVVFPPAFLALGAVIIYFVLVFYIQVASYLFLPGKDSCFIKHVQLVPYQRD